MLAPRQRYVILASAMAVLAMFVLSSSSAATPAAAATESISYCPVLANGWLCYQPGTGWCDDHCSDDSCLEP